MMEFHILGLKVVKINYEDTVKSFQDSFMGICYKKINPLGHKNACS